MLKMRILLLITLALLLPSCAFVDQKVDLAYEAANIGTGGSGDVYIARPIDNITQDKNAKGQLIIGTVKNTYGIKTADVVTEDSVSDWIVNAFTQELSFAGYKVHPVESLPDEVSKGLQIFIFRVFVDQDPGFFTVGAISEVCYNVQIWKNGENIAQINVKGKGDERSAMGSAETKGLSLKKALEASIQEAMPQIINALE